MTVIGVGDTVYQRIILMKTGHSNFNITSPDKDTALRKNVY